MTRHRLWSFALALGLLAVSAAAKADGLTYVPYGPAPAVRAPLVPPGNIPRVVAPAVWVQAPPGYQPVYSYYVTQPARIYAGMGSNDFPFYGQVYGHPYDRWTWANLSAQPYGGILNRYYYPPVR